MPFSSWSAFLRLAADSLFIYLCLILFPSRHQAIKVEAIWSTDSTSTVSTPEVQDPIRVSFVNIDPHEQQQERQQQSGHYDIQPPTDISQATPTAKRQPSVYQERYIMERRLRDFVRDVRHDPMMLPRQPRGFRNPWNLCYRNSVIVALLHSRRFVAFLHLHERHSSSRAGGPASALLTRFHALAAAYWEPADEGNDRCETLHALLWRACNNSQVDSPIEADEEKNRPRWRRSCQSWQVVCGGQEPSVVGGSDRSKNTPLQFWGQQQDAVAFWDWIVKMARAQLLVAPARGCADRYGRVWATADWFSTMFDVRLMTRWVEERCWQPAQQKQGTTTTTTRQVGLKVPVGPEREGGKTKTLDDLLAAFFLEDVRLFDDGSSGADECPQCRHSCDRCDSSPLSCPGRFPLHPRRWLQRQLLAAPELLPVHLMRVDFNALGRPVIKYQTAVDVPELLDVSQWLAPHIFAAGSRVVYRLSTVISHRGCDAQSGHYVAHVRYGGDGKEDASDASKWARVDDRKVTLDVPFQEVTNVGTAGKDERYDPVLLVYEKWIEQYADNTTTAGGGRRWRGDEASAHADEPVAKKPRS